MSAVRAVVVATTAAATVVGIAPVRRLAVRWFTRVNGTWVGVVPGAGKAHS